VPLERQRPRARKPDHSRPHHQNLHRNFLTVMSLSRRSIIATQHRCVAIPPTALAGKSVPEVAGTYNPN
jgi:hypothetical protein